jgi:hypothetical protein
MITQTNILKISCAAAVIALFLIISHSWALDTVVLKNGKVIQGAIIRLDSLSLVISPWEDRNALFPRGDVYTKDEIRTVSFDATIPSISSLVGEKELYIGHGVWELSTGISFRSVDPEEGSSTTYLNIPLRAGYFLARNLSAELEIMASQPKGQDMGYMATASALLHPKFKALNPTPWMRGFLLLGFGFGTGLPQGSTIPATDTDPMNVIQGGAGVKVGEGRVGLRLEYRFASLFGKREKYQTGINQSGEYYAYRVEETQSDIFHTVLLGFSVFLGR